MPFFALDEMINKHMYKKLPFLFSIALLVPLTSCNQYVEGTIFFDLDGGSFTDPTFNTTSLVGEAGTRINIQIPNAYKEGYYFVGWREKDSAGNYREITPKIDSETGEYYYVYPYGTDTLYAYFEPLVEIAFDLTDAVNRNGQLIAPTIDVDKSFSDGVLNGYANKTIPSEDYLPIASGDNLYFSYWYTEYPLVRREEDNTSHYYLDTAQPIGEYPFVEQFESGMVFPAVEDSQQLVLKAKWQEYPRVTVHFNIDGYSDESFQVERNATISKELEDLMLAKLDLDLTAAKDEYLFTSQDGNIYRFDGFFLDSSLTKQFNIDSSLSISDIDLYLKWSRQIEVTLDYDGGLFDNASSMSVVAYEGDALGESYDEIKPTKDNADFIGFYNGDVKFNFVRYQLPAEDLTLVARYEEYPTLTFSYSYPEDYIGDKETDLTFIFKENSDITSALEQARNFDSDDTLMVGEFYTLVGGEKNSFTATIMPEDDTIIYVELLYKPLINLITLFGKDDSYQTGEEGLTYLSKSIDHNAYLDEETVFTAGDSTYSLKNDYVFEDKIYLYDGLYADIGFSSRIELPYALSFSTDKRNEITLYRKMTEAIKLNFYMREGEELISMNKSLNVLPDKYLSDYIDDLQDLLGDFDHLEIKVGDVYQTITTFLPSVDSDILVIY